MTIKFTNAYIKNSYTLLGRNEYNVKLKVDEKINDYYNGEKSVEMGEVSYQIKSTKGILKKEKLNLKDINLVIGGDLQNQLLSSNFALRKFDVPFLGIYSACSTFTEGVLIGAIFVDKSLANNVIVNTSAHNLASEKQFRFPIEYGALRKKVNTFTATGSVSALVSNSKSNIRVESATIGKVIDLGYTDANNMGACMASGAGESLYEHFKDTGRMPTDYDLILTGDLGVYGVEILKDYLKEKYNIVANNIKDAGVMLFESESGYDIAGGSGPVCLPLILFSKILKDNYKKILLVGTGSLHSKVSTNLSESIPSISHIVSLEVIK